MKYRAKKNNSLGLPEGTELIYDANLEGVLCSGNLAEWYIGSEAIQWQTDFEPIEEFKEGDYRFCKLNRKPYRINKKMEDGRYIILWLYDYGNDCTELVNKTSLENDWKLSKDEIESALVKEAKRRGFDKQSEIECIEDGKHWNVSGNHFRYLPENDLLAIDDLAYIYKQGNWAEIIEDTITINGHKVDIEDVYVKVGCSRVSKSVITNLANYNESYDIAIYREGEDITKQIKQIAERL